MAKVKGSNKTVCPVGRDEFKKKAKPLTMRLVRKDKNGKEVIVKEIDLLAKEFSTMSLGWGFNEAQVFEVIEGIPAKVMVGVNLTIANSKDAK